MTLGHIGHFQRTFSENVYNGYPINNAKFGGAVRRRFSLFAKKSQGAASTPLAGRGLIVRLFNSREKGHAFILSTQINCCFYELMENIKKYSRYFGMMQYS